MELFHFIQIEQCRKGSRAGGCHIWIQSVDRCTYLFTGGGESIQDDSLQLWLAAEVHVVSNLTQ